MNLYKVNAKNKIRICIAISISYYSQANKKPNKYPLSSLHSRHMKWENETPIVIIVES
jgi:hypothetical protein